LEIQLVRLRFVVVGEDREIVRENLATNRQRHRYVIVVFGDLVDALPPLREANIDIGHLFDVGLLELLPLLVVAITGYLAVDAIGGQSEEG